LVEKKTGLDGNRTLIQGGFCGWCRAGSIFAHDILRNLAQGSAVEKVNGEAVAAVYDRRVSYCAMANCSVVIDRRYNFVRPDKA
jgi:hypothetical protein